MMFERRYEPLLPLRKFVLRLMRSVLLALCIIAFALGLGILGYHFIAEFSWVDSLVNASMILSGMGPVGDFKNDRGKVFASFYALFSGLMFVTVASIIVAPVAHRLLHWFHVEDEGKGKKAKGK
jgi:TRAP-type C4-dicarboxylate transport system permease small subunit